MFTIFSLADPALGMLEDLPDEVVDGRGATVGSAVGVSTPWAVRAPVVLVEGLV
jgi:hypothetical protein